MGFFRDCHKTNPLIKFFGRITFEDTELHPCTATFCLGYQRAEQRSTQSFPLNFRREQELHQLPGMGGTIQLEHSYRLLAVQYD